jgi:hypothetical protein
MRYLEENLFYCDKDFKLDVLQFYEEIRSELEEWALDDPETEKRLPTTSRFKALAPFIRDFRCRNRLVLRRPSLKRRYHVNEETVAVFIACVWYLLDHVPAERILNLDGTNWRSVSAGFLTWARAGADADINLSRFEKSRFGMPVYEIEYLYCSSGLSSASFNSSLS